MAKLLDGKNLAKQIMNRLKREVLELQKSTERVPSIVNVMLGEDAGSCSYANSQKRVAEHIGIQYRLDTLVIDTSQDVLIKYIQKLNSDETVNGIMIHKPVPEHITYPEVSNCLDIAKDMEGINVANIGKMILGQSQIIPCTPAAVMEHIKSTGEDLRGKEVVIIGHSEIVGKPLSLLLLREYATVTVCHVATFEAGKLQDHIARADVLVVAVGKPELIKGDWIKPGAIVVDVGINQIDGKIIGDIEFETAKQKASYITPVPGGVGPVTVVMLMQNAIEAFKIQNQNITELRKSNT